MKATDLYMSRVNERAYMYHPANMTFQGAAITGRREGGKERVHTQEEWNQNSVGLTLEDTSPSRLLGKNFQSRIKFLDKLSIKNLSGITIFLTCN